MAKKVEIVNWFTDMGSIGIQPKNDIGSVENDIGSIENDIGSIENDIVHWERHGFNRDSA